MSETNAVRRSPSRATATRTRRRTTTKWGDRQQRRADIVEAAQSRIASDGYLSLNMRDLAADAGISPGTLYSYFATKEHLFATVYALAIRHHTEAFRPVATAHHGLVTLLAAVIQRHLDLYASYGRHFTLWSVIRHDADTAPTDRVPRELVAELREATIEHNHLLMDSLRDAAQRDGRRVTDERLVPSFLWSTLNGLADHLTTERHRLDPFPAGDLVEFAAGRLALALTDPLIDDAEAMVPTQPGSRR